MVTTSTAAYEQLDAINHLIKKALAANPKKAEKPPYPTIKDNKNIQMQASQEVTK
jgi:hypothetical protein